MWLIKSSINRLETKLLIENYISSAEAGIALIREYLEDDIDYEHLLPQLKNY